MLRDYVINAACVLMIIGFAAGAILQIELMKPRISFLSEAGGLYLITVHAWATTLSLIAICLGTMSYIRHKSTWGQWAIWLGFCIVPLLFSAFLQLIIANGPKDNVLFDTVYETAFRHALGVAILLVALGGMSALNKVKLRGVPLKISFGFALLIATSGTASALFQALLGLSGMPRRYIAYPDQYAQMQFDSSIAAIACLSLSVAYVAFLWLRPPNRSRVEDVF